MINLKVRIKAGSNGHYKTIDLMKCIKEKFDNDIIFPNKPLYETCLADLQLDSGEMCTYSYSNGVIGTWDNDLGEYMERDFVLCFS